MYSMDAMEHLSKRPRGIMVGRKGSKIWDQAVAVERAFVFMTTFPFKGTVPYD